MTEIALFLFFFFGFVSFYLGLVSLLYYPLALAYPLWERRVLQRAKATAFTPSVSVLVPAYNEERTIALSVESILRSDYPDFEVIVINDGSADGTEAQLQPYITSGRIRYLGKPNGGKASALNAGLAVAGGEIVLFTDADTVFEPHTIRNGVAYFADPSIGAVSGNDTPLHPRGWLQKMLVVTSHIGTGFVRRALSLARVLPIIPGNLGLVRTEILRRIRGFEEVWGEDLELTFRLHKEGVRVVYGASTRVLAECPHTLRGLWKQRIRWVRSYVKVLRMHRDMIADRRYGIFGYYLLFNSINMLVVPTLQVAALLLLPIAIYSGRFALSGWEWMAYLGFGFLLLAAVVSALLDKSPRDLLYLPYASALIVMSHFYNAVVVYSLWSEWRARAESWNKLERRDIKAVAAEAPPSHARRVVVGGIAGAAAVAVVGILLSRSPEVTYLAKTLPARGRRKHQLTVSIHFADWDDWRDAYRTLLATPQASAVDRVAVSAGRPDWTFFKWKDHRQWWSSTLENSGVDMLGEAVEALRARGYAVTAVLDVFAERYLSRHPEAAARDIHGKPSREIVCSTLLAEGDYGRLLNEAIEGLATTTQADAIGVTECFYDDHCYDERCLTAFKKATGLDDWPRTPTGEIDRHADAVGRWRSRQISGVAKSLAAAVHRHGKKLAFDVKVSRPDISRNGRESGQDYDMLAPHVDQFVAWDYFALEDLPPESSADVAAYFARRYGEQRFHSSIGLWSNNSGFVSADLLAASARAALRGGAVNLWITPSKAFTAQHWQVIEAIGREISAASDRAPSSQLASVP